MLDEFEPIFSAWLSWIEPGGFILTHRDGGPYRQRWQVPIRPGPMIQHGETIHPAAGVAFEVEHWSPHSIPVLVRPRVHLVIDRDVLLDVPTQPFQIIGAL